MPEPTAETLDVRVPDSLAECDGVEPRWLTEDEMQTWLPLVGVLLKLPSALDSQLQRDAGLSHFHYLVLAMLSEAPDRRGG